MLVCPHCGLEVDLINIGEPCTNCGIQIPQEMMEETEAEEKEQEDKD
jgi:phage-related holin